MTTGLKGLVEISLTASTKFADPFSSKTSIHFPTEEYIHRVISSHDTDHDFPECIRLSTMSVKNIMITPREGYIFKTNHKCGLMLSALMIMM